MSNTNIYGYLNASLHYAYYKKTAIERTKQKKSPSFRLFFLKQPRRNGV